MESISHHFIVKMSFSFQLLVAAATRRRRWGRHIVLARWRRVGRTRTPGGKRWWRRQEAASRQKLVVQEARQKRVR